LSREKTLVRCFSKPVPNRFPKRIIFLAGHERNVEKEPRLTVLDGASDEERERDQSPEETKK